MNRNRKQIISMLLTLIISGIIGMLLLIAVYCLPTERIKSHLASGAYIYLQETAYFQYADGYVSTLLDNYTDALMLNKTAYPSHNPVQDAVNAPSYWYEGSRDNLELISYLNDQDGTHYSGITTYARYWHGYQVILRPFFEFFDFSDMEIFNQILQLCLLFVVILLMERRGLSRFLPAFLAMILFWNPASMGVSLQYSPCYYISLGACAFILQKRKTIHNIRGLFLLAGILTVYFDFLTYPAATLGVPLVMWMIVHRNDEELSFGSLFRNVFWWCAGYVGMWAEKWLLGTLLTSSNLFTEAADKIAERSSTQAGDINITRLGTLAYLIRYSMAKWPYLILFGLVFAGILLYRKYVRKHSDMKATTSFAENVDWRRIALFMLAGFIPFAWILMAANHCYIHPRLTYRVLGITIFAWLLALTAMPSFRRTKIALNTVTR